MGEDDLDAVPEDPFEPEHQTWPEREEREQKATHVTSLAFEPDRTTLAARRFAVLPGHEVEDVERVVESYLVVEKNLETVRQAEESDPRG